jgi:tRNA(His) 5'-end guanylyltransferase
VRFDSRCVLIKQDKNDDPLHTLIKETRYNSLLIETVFELLAEKNILTGEAVVERFERPGEDGPSNPYGLH